MDYEMTEAYRRKLEEEADLKELAREMEMKELDWKRRQADGDPTCTIWGDE